MTTGRITADAEAVLSLSVRNPGEDQVVLGDGRVVTMPTFEALVRFGETTRRFSVEQAPTEPLVGTELLWGYGLRVDSEPGGRVEMEALP